MSKSPFARYDFFSLKSERVIVGDNHRVTSVFRGGPRYHAPLPLHVTLHMKFTHVRFMCFLLLIQTVQPSPFRRDYLDFP